MKFATEMGSGAMIVRKLIRRIHRQNCDVKIITFIFQNKGRSIKNRIIIPERYEYVLAICQ